MDNTERFRGLIEPLHDRVLGFARSLCRSISEGDDLFQEAMLRSFSKLDSLRDDQAFQAWTYRIVIRVHRSRARRAFWRRLLPLGSDEPHDDDHESTGGEYRSDWSPDIAEANRRARAALSRLPAAQREAIVLFEIEGWKVEEIADVQNVSVSAVKSRLARGRERMRELYESSSAIAIEPAPTTEGT
jgi:RNA polymerase sigma-70 factor (ECF subfamily)